MKRMPPFASREESSGPIFWFASNPVAANLLVLLILFAGVASLTMIEKEVLPHFSPHRIEIKAHYPGASPLEIEQAVCIRIEEAIHDLPGSKLLVSESEEGVCTVEMTVLPGHDKDSVMNAVRGRVQALQRLPKELERIDIQRAYRQGDNGVIWVALHGRSDPLSLKRFGDRIQSDLARLPGVTRALNYNEIPYEIAIEVSSKKLQRYRMSLHDVTETLRRQSVDLPAGVIKNPDGELLLRANGKARDGEALGNMELRADSGGGQVLLRDVAEIKDGLEERLSEWRHNGENAQGWEIHADRDSVEVARHVKDYVSTMSDRLPEGLSLYTWWDDSQSYEERIGTLVENGLYGFILVCAVLTLFLDSKLAFWAGAGIVTSMFGAFGLMLCFGISLNMLSLFGFILAIGILVDDAIIVSEAIHRNKAVEGRASRENLAEEGLVAAIRGTREVVQPVTLAVATTIAAFLPGLFVSGWAGRMMQPICGVLIAVLLFSVIEALLILPAHLATSSKPSTSSSPVARWRGTLNRSLAVFIRRIYGPLLNKALVWRYLTVSLFAVFILMSIALVAGGHLRWTLQANVTKSSFSAHLDMPQAAPYSETRRVAGQVEAALLAMRRELDDSDRPQPYYSKRCHNIEPASTMLVGLETMIGEHGAGFWTELSPDGRQCIVVEPFIREWRRRIGDSTPGKIDFIYKEGDVRYDLEYDLAAADSAELALAVARFKNELSDYPGVHDVIDSAEPGKPEARLRLKPAAEILGLRLEEIAEQVRHGYYGDEVYRVQRGRSEIKVVVRLPLRERQSLTDLRRLPIRLAGGGLVPLETVADVELTPGYAKLTRQQRQRVLKVRARVDPALADVNAIHAKIENVLIPQMQRQFPQLGIETSEARQEQKAMLRTLIINTSIALTLIYMMIAIPYRSYTMPLIFMLAAPAAWCGGIWAHWLAELPLSMESLVGMIAASGVVVNDSLVLLDTIKRNEEGIEGPTETQVYHACSVRFRPILLAFLTTFAGFFPTLLETSEQAQFLIPMTLSLASGLLVGMVASLVLTPVCYTIIYGDQYHRNDELY